MSEESEFQSAKAFLLQSATGDRSGSNVYDHLASVIARLLDERPANGLAVLEEVSQQTKAAKFDAATTFRVR